MIFRYPLERRGFYYMDKSTYLQIMANREERAVFFLILREVLEKNKILRALISS